MLMMLGPVRFEIVPFNATGYDHAHEAAFVEKPVLGAPMPLEYVGEGAETWGLRAKLFPDRFGGLSALDRLEQARRAGQPQYMMRGDGALMGWVVIEKVSERSSWLGPGGVGKIIEIDIALRRTTAPGAAAYFTIFSGVFQ